MTKMLKLLSWLTLFFLHSMQQNIHYRSVRVCVRVFSVFVVNSNSNSRSPTKTKAISKIPVTQLGLISFSSVVVFSSLD